VSYLINKNIIDKIISLLLPKMLCQYCNIVLSDFTKYYCKKCINDGNKVEDSCSNDYDSDSDSD